MTATLIRTLLVLLCIAATVSALGLKCHTCKKSKSNEECNRKGSVVDCPFGVCMTKVEYKYYGVVKKIEKWCGKIKDCKYQCDKKFKKCYYCCWEDYCNKGCTPGGPGTTPKPTPKPTTKPPYNPCRPNPCKNAGYCRRNGNNYSCVCLPGFTGRNCQERVTPKPTPPPTPPPTSPPDSCHPCLDFPCQNDGICIPTTKTLYVCLCKPGFYGDNCELRQPPKDPCATKPCQNDGTCYSHGDKYYCECPPRFSGRNCEIRLDPCKSAPCLNGGSCEVQDGDNPPYLCKCPPGYSGPRCENAGGGGGGCPKFSCGNIRAGLFPDPKSCRHFYHCANWIAYRKICPAKLHFNPKLKVCDYPHRAGCKPTRNPCDDRPCQNGGTCVMLPGNQYQCNCPPGFSGKNCEIKDGGGGGRHPCDDKPCQNGGTCLKLPGKQYKCKCPPGFKGNNCEIKEGGGGGGHPCDSKPCQNGGVCIKLPGNLYVCKCPPGFKGRNCEIKGGGGGDGGDGGGGGGKFRSVGCFKDNPNDRAFDFGPWTDNAMTVSKCAAFCRGKSYQVAGLQNGQECWCGKGEGFRKHGELTPQRCNKFCIGDPKKQYPCGSGWVNSVYKV